MKKITLLWGLPGSGKTTYAKSIKDQNSLTISLDDDSRWNKGFIGRNFGNYVQDILEKSWNHVIIDGLILTNVTAGKFLEIARFACTNIPVQFSIVWWEKDIEACLHNDRGRREKNSEITIKNAVLEEPSAALLTEFGIPESSVIRRKVVRKPIVEAIASEVGLKVESGNMVSETWSLGGTSGHYEDPTRTIEADSQPAFVEFDRMLEATCPAITYLQYKRTYADSVRIETREESDYYGGSITYAQYVCNLSKLNKALFDMGLIAQVAP